MVIAAIAMGRSVVGERLQVEQPASLSRKSENQGIELGRVIAGHDIRCRHFSVCRADQIGFFNIASGDQRLDIEDPDAVAALRGGEADGDRLVKRPGRE